MPMAFYICAGITALLIIFALGSIAGGLRLIHEDLVMLQTPEEGGNPIILFNKKPAKQREYWRDQNGFRHWRKVKDA